MKSIAATDSYGRRTVFRGELLVSENTDDLNGLKPQWVEVDVWRTEGGAFVVRKATHYGIIHADADCARLVGYATRRPTEDDTYACRTCVPNDAQVVTGWAQESRITVDAYRTAADFIESLKVKGEFNRLSRTLLAEVSRKDAGVDALWNTVVVD